ncbi:MAG: hypothetical protein M1412_08295 [Deltaproteobacteria bacterium]|nr:hypothetical protein [Deltaproteobacteria bacterium]MCL5893142.1 hypothetical protein [Deltaproteobacteria bacterium]
MNIGNIATISYIVLFILSTIYFYRSPRLLSKKNLKDSLLMAIGFASIFKLLIFTIILPKYFNIQSVIPSTDSVITIIVVVIYGIHLGKVIEPEKPKPVEEKECNISDEN